MAGAYSPVTVLADTRRVDLALPNGLPVADLLPQLVEACAGDAGGVEPARWTLRRLDGRSVATELSLAEAQIRDGEVLTLHPEPGTIRPAHIDDVRDAVEDSVDATPQWSPATTLRFALLLGGIGLAALAFTPAAGRALDGRALGGAAVVTAVSVAAAAWADRRHYRDVAVLWVVVASEWGALTGALAATWWSAGTVGRAAAAAVAAPLVAALAGLVTPRAIAPLAALAGLAAAVLGITGTVLAGGDPRAAVRIEAVLIVLAIGALPKLSLALGGLAGADYRVRNAERLSQEQFTRKMVDSGALLTGALVGSCLAAAGLGLFLAGADGSWDRLLSLALAGALLLRSRIFSRIWHVAPVRLAGVALLVGHAVRVVPQTAVLRGWLVPLALVVVVALALLSAVRLPDITRTRIRYLLHLAEVVLVAALLTIAAAALGVFQLVAELTR